MSWQAYVDTQLVATQYETKHACQSNRRFRLGNDANFQPRYYEADTSDDQGNPKKITVNEVTDLTTCFANGFASAPSSGLCEWSKIYVARCCDGNGTKYIKAQKGSCGLCMAAMDLNVIATADKKSLAFTNTIAQSLHQYHTLHNLILKEKYKEIFVCNIIRKLSLIFVKMQKKIGRRHLRVHICIPPGGILVY